MFRIKIPTLITTLIINLFKNRELKVIIDSGFTSEFKAGDGIDQGETLLLFL